MRALAFSSIMTRESAATFPEKSQAAHCYAFNKAFNATDNFNSPVCEAAYCFFPSLLALRVNGYHGRTNKQLLTADDETETEVRSKNAPISDYAIGAAKDNKMTIFEIITLN